jgi:hypothetical protein
MDGPTLFTVLFIYVIFSFIVSLFAAMSLLGTMKVSSKMIALYVFLSLLCLAFTTPGRVAVVLGVLAGIGAWGYQKMPVAKLETVIGVIQIIVGAVIGVFTLITFPDYPFIMGGLLFIAAMAGASGGLLLRDKEIPTKLKLEVKMIEITREVQK